MRCLPVDKAVHLRSLGRTKSSERCWPVPCNCWPLRAVPWRQRASTMRSEAVSHWENHLLYTYVFKYTYIMHACIHAYVHTCIHGCMHTYIHACMHTYIHTYIHTYVRYLHTYACMHNIHYTHMCDIYMIHVHIHMHLCSFNN